MSERKGCNECIHQEVCYLRIIYPEVEALLTLEYSKESTPQRSKSIKFLSAITKYLYKFGKVCPYYISNT